MFHLYPTAKNVILSGVKSVTLHDKDVCTMKDLASQVNTITFFYAFLAAFSDYFAFFITLFHFALSHFQLIFKTFLNASKFWCLKLPG